MIGQGLLESGWLEPVPNARDGGAVFKDEYVLYQPGVVRNHCVIRKSIWAGLHCTSAATIHQCTNELQYFLLQYEYRYFGKILRYYDIVILHE